jgi:hypothetical protein
MVDTTVPPVTPSVPSAPVADAPAVEKTPAPEPSPEQKAQMEAQQLAQKMMADIARGKNMITISCLNLCNLAIGLLPRPDAEEETPAKNKKNPARRMLTIADLDKVSAIVERFTQSVANLSGGGMGPMGPMGMMRPGMR